VGRTLRSLFILCYGIIRRTHPTNKGAWDAPYARYSNGKPKPHQGWDFAAQVGTPTYAIADGKVEFVRKNFGAYGTQICIQFKFKDKIYYAFYAHLNSTRVTQGAKIKKGQQIATTGISGNAKRLPKSEAHLHFEIRTRAWCGKGLGGRVSPLVIFGNCPLKSSVVVTPVTIVPMAPMFVSIKGAVGKNGNNFVEDVLIVQKLLNNKTKPPYTLLTLNGICDSKMVATIERFQQEFMQYPDGRIDPNGLTIGKLNEL
jgi:murein DD-endopeptidase MepM/ murein hydrolase activator NlpD